ncbi:MAG: hypothetical protein Fur0037_26620 [Planctomycetota bacterium]
MKPAAWIGCAIVVLVVLLIVAFGGDKSLPLRNVDPSASPSVAGHPASRAAGDLPEVPGPVRVELVPAIKVVDRSDDAPLPDAVLVSCSADGESIGIDRPLAKAD